MLTLPAIRKTDFTFPHFPAQFQTFIFRCASMLTPRRIASALGCTADEVTAEARRMGIDSFADASAETLWLEKGYITIIRAVWHILTYEQICVLLSWDEEKLAYTLKEDDFLSVKLGNFKPDCPTLAIRELTPDELARTEQLRRDYLEFRSLTGEKQPSPFKFEFPTSVPELHTDSKGLRIAYSYCALYGDTFLSDTSYSFPDSLLEAYRRLGVNGIWCQAVLYTIAPYPFMPELSENYEKRVEGMKKLTERMAKYGIKLYLYMNEPRALPNAYFKEHQELAGHTIGDFTCLCTSAPEVERYLFDSAAYLAEKVPLLGGFITITASENQTNCYSHTEKPSCPRCSAKNRWDVIAGVNNALFRGGRSKNPDFRLIAWSWGWNDLQVDKTCAALDRGITVQCVSEHNCRKTVGGTTTSVDDYSISVIGPGKYATDTWDFAKAAGHDCCAKVQLNNSWELSTVPYLPVFDTVWEHLSRLRANGVTNLMLDWTLGGYPAPAFSLASAAFSGDKLPDREQVFASLFSPAVRAASAMFSEAFDQYPFHIGVIYDGPQNVGPANLLYEKPTSMRATMVCYPYDDLGSWRSIYGDETFERQFELVAEKWGEGVQYLRDNGENGEIADVADAAWCHFRSSYLQIRFVRLRESKDNGAELEKLLAEEEQIAARLAKLMVRRPEIGFESSNHYFYTYASLAEKYIDCKYLGGRL